MYIKLPPDGGPTVILSIVGGTLQVQGTTRVILPPNAPPIGFEKDKANTATGVTKSPNVTNATIISFMITLYP